MNRIITLLAMIVCYTLTLSAGTYSSGVGSVSDLYQIANLADLVELSETTADCSNSYYFSQTAKDSNWQ